MADSNSRLVGSECRCDGWGGVEFRSVAYGDRRKIVKRISDGRIVFRKIRRSDGV